jgi:hypothetical protein
MNSIAAYLEDVPAADPQFDFDLAATALASIFRAPASGAVVLGIHGPWGSGKTTMLRALQRALDAELGEGGSLFVEFNAWKFHQRDALWRALILQVVGQLRDVVPEADQPSLNELESSLYRAFSVEQKGPWQVNTRALITEAVSLGLSVLHLDFVAKALTGPLGWVKTLFGGKSDGSGVLDKDRIEAFAGILERDTITRQVDQVVSIEQFLDRFRSLVEKVSASRRRIFVFVDDLDRCLPEEALEVFEAIKLFLDSPNVGFAVALDREVIRKGLKIRYASKEGSEAPLIDPDEYMEKTISLSFDLPRLSEGDVLAIVDSLELPRPLTDADRGLITTALGVNPRRVKRFANTLRLNLYLAELASQAGRTVPAALQSADPGLFTAYLKLLLLGYRYPALLSTAQQDPAVLTRLQAAANAYRGNSAAEGAKETRTKALFREPSVLHGLAFAEEFWLVMSSPPSFSDDHAATRGLINWFRSSSAS